MLNRAADYFHDFHCLAGACPHTCCAGWEVMLDEETALRYFQVPGALGEKLRSVIQADAEGDFCFHLRGGRCPFLNEENLCEIHLQLGEAATSVTCRSHPRFIEDYGAFREIPSPPPARRQTNCCWAAGKSSPSPPGRTRSDQSRQTPGWRA